jgi:ABC-type transporter Mla subunit MlaD
MGFSSEHFRTKVWERSILMAEILIRLSDKAQSVAGLCLVGIFLFSAFLILWFSGAFSPKYRLRVYAPDVSGLRTPNQVELDGVPVGSVSALNVAGESSSPERRIEVDLRIDKPSQAQGAISGEQRTPSG